MPGITPFHAAPVDLGAGILFGAPLGTTAPTGIHGGPDATAVPGTNGTQFGTGWVQLGYTVDGSEFDYTPTVSGISVAESNIDLKQAITKAVYSLKFDLAEKTAQNLSLALNAGLPTIAVPADPVIHVTIGQPTPGLEPRVMLGWDRIDGKERWIFYQCLQVGAVKVMHKKAPAIASLPVEFMLEQPPTGNPYDARIAKTLILST